MIEFETISPPVDMVNVTPVVFENDTADLMLAGIIFMPKNVSASDLLPTILIQGPLGTVKEQAQSLYAQLLAAQGYLTMVYDYSYLGASQGSPRGLEDPAVRISDIRSALKFLKTWPQVDRERIYTLGLGCSGAYLLDLGTTDQIKATIAINPMTMLARIQCFSEDKVERAQKLYEKTGRVTRMDLFEKNSAGANYHFNARRGAVPNRIGFPIWSQLAWHTFEPNIKATRAKVPFLVIIGENAFTRPGAEVMFENLASATKKRIIISQAGHFDLYDLKAYVSQVITAIVEFLNTLENS